MSKTSVQVQVLKPGGEFTLVSVPYPVPGPDEICIRTKALGLNPLDWKSRNFGVMVQSWPAVIGLDAAGIIESIGASVKDFGPGDEVMAHRGTGGNPAGAFQEIMTVPSRLVAKKPASCSFEEAAALPICYLTALAAIKYGLHVPMPHLDPTPSASSSLKSILVVGGSSNVGGAAIQLLRMALPSATILTTSSAKHHANLISLGATKCFERSAQGDVSVIKAATPGDSGVDAILDTVTAALSQPSLFAALNPSGPKIYTHPVTGDQGQVPEDVNEIPVFGPQILELPDVMPTLADLVQSGKYRLPVKVEVVGKGLDSIEESVTKLFKEGTSGTKYVVSV